MNNKHQELIEEKVEEMLSMFDDRSLFDIGSFDNEIQEEIGEDMRQTLQQTINKVLAVQKEELKQNLHDKIKHTFNGYGGVHGFTRFDLHDFVDKALDKTPPNKV